MIPSLKVSLLAMRGAVLIAFLRRHGADPLPKDIEKMALTMTDAQILRSEIERRRRPWWKRLMNVKL
jgi:hypothetical protein